MTTIGNVPDDLPDALTLADLVSEVTETMCGAKFIPAQDPQGEYPQGGESICGSMVLLPIPGVRDISVVMSSDASGAQALGSALCYCPREQLTKAMIDDAIAELVNMVAGRIKAALEIDQMLGLPRATSLAEISQSAGVDFSDGILLTSQGIADLKLWIFETFVSFGQTPEAERGRTNRSLFRKDGARP